MQEFKRVTVSIVKSALAAYLVGSVAFLLVLFVFSLRDAFGAVEAVNSPVVKLDAKSLLKSNKIGK